MSQPPDLSRFQNQLVIAPTTSQLFGPTLTPPVNSSVNANAAKVTNVNLSDPEESKKAANVLAEFQWVQKVHEVAPVETVSQVVEVMMVSMVSQVSTVSTVGQV